MTVYRITCDHEGCDWASLIDIDGEVGEWRPPRDTGLVDAKGEPIIDEWEGTQIEYAYEFHHSAVHAPDSKPPMLAWSRQ